MFQLYSKRSFGSLVGDTLSFFKEFGKNYFKNYFIINGGFLLALVAIMYFLIKIFLEGAFSNFGSTDQGDNFINHIYSNLGLFIGLGITTVLLVILISMINYLFPVAYLKLIETNKDTSTENLINEIKSKIGKVIVFFLASIFIFIPIMLILCVIMFALIVVIIGIPLLFIVIPAVMCWISLSFYDYVSTDNGYFDSLGNGYRMLKKKFWPIIGSTAIMQIIVQVVIGVVSMIPYTIGVATVFTNPEAMQNKVNGVPEGLSLIMVLISVLMIVSILLNYTLQNLILINQGIIYYSIKEESENVSIKNDIDLIGSDSE